MSSLIGNHLQMESQTKQIKLIIDLQEVSNLDQLQMMMRTIVLMRPTWKRSWHDSLISITYPQMTQTMMMTTRMISIKTLLKITPKRTTSIENHLRRKLTLKLSTTYPLLGMQNMKNSKKPNWKRSTWTITTGTRTQGRTLALTTCWPIMSDPSEGSNPIWALLLLAHSKH